MANCSTPIFANASYDPQSSYYDNHCDYTKGLYNTHYIVSNGLVPTYFADYPFIVNNSTYPSPPSLAVTYDAHPAATYSCSMPTAPTIQNKPHHVYSTLPYIEAPSYESCGQYEGPLGSGKQQPQHNPALTVPQDVPSSLCLPTTKPPAYHPETQRASVTEAGPLLYSHSTHSARVAPAPSTIRAPRPIHNWTQPSCEHHIVQQLEGQAKKADWKPIPRDALKGVCNQPSPAVVSTLGLEQGRKRSRKNAIAFACSYCKYRKIKCIPDVEAEDKCCHQCARRGKKCTYPPESNPLERRRRKPRNTYPQTVHG